MIDLHCHILPGIDDGPATMSESLEIARAALAAGTRTVVATPHVSWHYPNESQTIGGLVEAVSQRLRDEAVELELRPGAEVAAERVLEIEPHELARLTLGRGRWILLEFPFTPNSYGLERVVAKIQSEGHRILLAHPERCPIFHRNPEMLRELVRGGALTSVTAGSLAGRFGTHVRRFALQMFDEDLAHNVTSDAHNLARRPVGMVDELDRAGLGALRGWLTEDVPAAILSGEEIPAQPAFPRAARSRGGRWLSRLQNRRA